MNIGLCHCIVNSAVTSLGQKATRVWYTVRYWDRHRNGGKIGRCAVQLSDFAGSDKSNMNKDNTIQLGLAWCYPIVMDILSPGMNR